MFECLAEEWRSKGHELSHGPQPHARRCVNHAAPPRNPKAVTYRSYPDIEQAVCGPAVIPVINLAMLTIDPVLGRAESQLWNTYIAHHRSAISAGRARRRATACVPKGTSSPCWLWHSR